MNTVLLTLTLTCVAPPQAPPVQAPPVDVVLSDSRIVKPKATKVDPWAAARARVAKGEELTAYVGKKVPFYHNDTEIELPIVKGITTGVYRCFLHNGVPSIEDKRGYELQNKEAKAASGVAATNDPFVLQTMDTGAVTPAQFVKQVTTQPMSSEVTTQTAPIHMGTAASLGGISSIFRTQPVSGCQGNNCPSPTRYFRR